MQSRFLKKLIYSAFYLAVFFGVGYLIYAAVLKSAPSCFDGRQNQGEKGIDCGGPCLSCELKNPKPITVSPVSIFGIDTQKVTALVELRNPNIEVGADRFLYTLNFFDSAGTIIRSITRESFIYPGEIKYIVETGIDIPILEIQRAQMNLSNFSWQPLQIFSLPKTQIRDIQVQGEPEMQRILVSGILVNQNAFRLTRTLLMAIVNDVAGYRIAASKTSLENIEPFEERKFLIIIPGIEIATIDRDRLQIFVEARR